MRFVTGRAGSVLRFGLIGLIILTALSFAMAPIAKSFVEQWTRKDVEARARLVYNSIGSTIARSIAEGRWGQLSSIFDEVAQDRRILAVGLCDSNGDLRDPTILMPRTFSCENVARSASESFSTIINNGRRVIVGSFPIATRDHVVYLVVLSDLSYADSRSGQLQNFMMATFLGVGIVIVAVAAILVFLVLRNWTDSLTRVIEERRFGRRAGAREFSEMDLQIETLMKELDAGRAPTETAEVEWSPKALHDLLNRALPNAEIIVVSNREPYIHNRTGNGIAVQIPASGLVAALEPIMRACGGTWIAHGSGSADRETVDRRDCIDVPPSAPAYTLRRVWLSEAEQDGYYYGLANEGLWPLCHVAFVRPAFRESDWQYYVNVNERVADAVAQEARTEDPLVLVQDYHFALAPKMIRARLPKATIITFWHIPWPNAETFGICPWKEEILKGLLGSSIIGFHTQFHCNNFFETVDRFVESRIDREHGSVILAGRETMIRPYPISIEWPPKALQGQASVQACRAAVRERFGLPSNAKLGVGIERFDYTKGVLDRLRAIDALLETHPEWKGIFTFVQVAAPTRGKLLSYRELQAEATTVSEAINARHGAGDYQPIRLIVRHHEADEVFELFRAADLCIVSSLHDGMNLVAKEFVAARDDDEGVLILSSFAGASRELSEALIVNPYDRRQMVEAYDIALRMSVKEQRERMHLMRQQVREQNVYRWAARMLVDAGRIRQRLRIVDISRTQSLRA